MVNLVAAAMNLPELKKFTVKGVVSRTAAREQIADRVSKMGVTLTAYESLTKRWGTKTKAKRNCDRGQIALELCRKITA